MSERVCSWLEKTGRNEWATTRDLTVHTPVGALWVPNGTKTDLFSKVPNTQHEGFWLASVVHDLMRRSDRWSRVEADIAFIYLMVEAALYVRKEMLVLVCEDDLSLCEHKRKANKECVRLLRIASLYLLGVSGVVGSVYIGFGKLKDKLFG